MAGDTEAERLEARLAEARRKQLALTLGAAPGTSFTIAFPIGG